MKKFIIAEEDFTVDNGMLTPMVKLKRKNIIGRYKDLIGFMYGDEDYFAN